MAKYGLLTSDHKVLGSKPTRNGRQRITIWRFISQSHTLSPLHRLDITNTVEKKSKTKSSFCHDSMGGWVVCPFAETFRVLALLSLAIDSMEGSCLR